MKTIQVNIICFMLWNGVSITAHVSRRGKILIWKIWRVYQRSWNERDQQGRGVEIPNVEKDVDKEIVLDEEDEIDEDDEPQQRSEKKVTNGHLGNRYLVKRRFASI